jgi:hypothetical protein
MVGLNRQWFGNSASERRLWVVSGRYNRSAIGQQRPLESAHFSIRKVAILRFFNEGKTMISLLAALMAGYALGTFVKGGRSAYLLCFPVSAVVYLLTKIVLTFFSDEGIQYPSIGILLGVGVLQTPLLALGVYLAQRKAKRSGYEI